MAIHQIAFKNFFSFRDESIINFEVNNKAPKSEGYFIDESNKRLSKVLTVVGANASGKTNLLKVLHFLKWFVLFSFYNKPGEEIIFQPFIFDASEKLSSMVSIDFNIDKDNFLYSLEFNQKQVLSENLLIKQKSKHKKVFTRAWNYKTKKYEYDLKNFGLPKDFEKLIKDNTSVISAAIQVDHNQSIGIKNFFLNIKGNVAESGRVEKTKSSFADLLVAADFFNSNKDLKNKAEELLKKFDLGLFKVDIKESEIDTEKGNKKEKIYLPYGVHKNDKTQKSLPFFYESSGTKNLLILLKDILPVLENGGVAALDEFDIDLHPHMIPELLQLFTSEIYNPKNAQLFFSTHHPEILNRLDKYQIVLVEKDYDFVSHAWRLDEIKGVRPDDNYYSKYMAGSYGSIPKFE